MHNIESFRHSIGQSMNLSHSFWYIARAIEIIDYGFSQHNKTQESELMEFMLMHRYLIDILKNPLCRIVRNQYGYLVELGEASFPIDKDELKTIFEQCSPDIKTKIMASMLGGKED